MNKKIIAALLLGALSMSMVACDGDKPNNAGKLFSGSDLKGAITENTTLDAAVAYKLNGTVSVKNGATLTIPAGTVITASEGFDRYIIVEQGGKIDIQGTAAKPVIMTGEVEDYGSWGGLIINGKAPLTSSEKDAKTEINPALKYGGSDANDNSGSIKYLAIKYAGKNNNDNIEHNGLTLNGVGAGTTIENVFIFKSADDGIEFFGGTVSVKNYLSVDSDDDMFDLTQGWHGTLTNAYGVWTKNHISTEKDPRALEADGNFDGLYPNDNNQSVFTLKNVTVDLQMAPSDVKGYFMDDVFKVRRGATGTVSNALVKGTGACKNFIDTKDDKGNGTLTIDYTNKLVNAPFDKFQSEGGKINATEEPGNTGCDKALFSWTGYNL